MLANPFNWRVRWPRPARVPLFSLGLRYLEVHVATAGGWLTRYRPREVRNSIYRYRKIHIDYRSKFLYRFISPISIIYGNTNGSHYSTVAWWKSIFIENLCFYKWIKPKLICNPDLIFRLAEHLATFTLYNMALSLYHLEEMCHPDLTFWPAPSIRHLTIIWTNGGLDNWYI